jgi:PAS domain S-box-containing protein
MKGEFVKLSLTSQKIREGILIYFHEAKREQEIENFNLQTQTILNAVTNAIIMVDKDGKVKLVNEAFKRLIEEENVNIAGMDIRQVKEMAAFGETELAQLLFSGSIMDKPLEATFRTLKGNRRDVLLYDAPIKNIDDEIIGSIGVATDITEMKKQQYQVQQQEKLAKIGQMAAGIVHEIKNPLATIKGLSQLIFNKTTQDKVKEYAGVINSSIDDASRVVNDFLNFAKPKPTVKVRTSINKIVESVQLMTETQCYTKNIKCRFNFLSLPMEITADEIKIKQVLLNLIENAIAAMEDIASPELTIATYYDPDKQEGVIQVKDNGIGMSPEVIEKLGTPFYTTREKGTGLGLGICYQIIGEHGGRLEVQSEVGKGTTFEVIFSQIEDVI